MFKIAETCFSSAILSGYPYANFFCTFLPLAPELRATITYTPSASWRSLGVYVAFPTMKLLVWQYRPEFERGRWDHPFTGPDELPFTGRFSNSWTRFRAAAYEPILVPRDSIVFLLWFPPICLWSNYEVQERSRPFQQCYLHQTELSSACYHAACLRRQTVKISWHSLLDYFLKFGIKIPAFIFVKITSFGSVAIRHPRRFQATGSSVISLFQIKLICCEEGESLSINTRQNLHRGLFSKPPALCL